MERSICCIKVNFCPCPDFAHLARTLMVYFCGDLLLVHYCGFLLLTLRLCPASRGGRILSSFKDLLGVHVEVFYKSNNSFDLPVSHNYQECMQSEAACASVPAKQRLLPMFTVCLYMFDLAEYV
jgi:hypothetical protein